MAQTSPPGDSAGQASGGNVAAVTRPGAVTLGEGSW
jgi:hypothetical protein